MSTQIQQAIFTSTDRGAIKGYQLVAMSNGINRNLAKELYRWSPSQMGVDHSQSWSINYYPVTEGQVAVSRTILGGPEYSARGGSQVVTMIALLSNEQFKIFDNNALLFAHTCMALGWLRLPQEIPSRLPTFLVPDYPIANGATDRIMKFEVSKCESLDAADDSHINDSDIISQAVRLAVAGKRFAVVGAHSPLNVVEALIAKLPSQTRRQFSFTTGLAPAVHRPFQAHFFPDVSPITTQTLKSQDIVLLPVQPRM
ncbi:MAG: hypothetical protein R3C53_26695 [Pirellulaceae bacterium]